MTYSLHTNKTKKLLLKIIIIIIIIIILKKKKKKLKGSIDVMQLMHHITWGSKLKRK